MRFDFGARRRSEAYLSPGVRDGGTCIGCHTLSPDGTKMAASAGGQDKGLLEYINNIAAPSAPLPRRRAEDGNDRIQFASFDPFGDLFVGVYGEARRSRRTACTSTMEQHGLISPGRPRRLSFEPDHPGVVAGRYDDRDDARRAHNTSQREYPGGIDVATFAAGAVRTEA